MRDDGIGVEAEHLASIFEMFTQVDRSNRRTQGGLGIGLTLVRSLVMMHGGTVAARSKGVYTGSEFEVRLPLASAAAGATRAPDSVVEFRDRRILIVDMLLIALTGWGQEKDRRRSRGAGIDHHLVKPPDVSRLKELFTASAGPPRPPKLA